MKFSFKIKINKVIKYLILSDLIFYSGWGLVSPIFGVFIVEKIQGGTVAVVGVAAAIYWILSSLLRIPIGLFLDSRKGEEDDFWFLFFGLFIASLAPFGYLIALYSWHIYLLQILYAIGMAMTISGWSAIFTRHIDKGKEAFEWGLNGTSAGIGAGIASALGGLIAFSFGFRVLFILVGLLGIIGTLVLLPALKFISPRSLDKGMIFSLKELFQRERK